MLLPLTFNDTLLQPKLLASGGVARETALPLTSDIGKKTVSVLAH